MFRYLVYIGLALLIPGLASLGICLWQGPVTWNTHAQTFWGTPISLFVFWIGLAHAGTLLSAIFLALNVKLDRRTALLAELSTLCALSIAAIFPLMHLGVLENFYMVIPLMDGRSNFANLRSPLVWDFICIAVYAVLSLLFFVTHLANSPALSLDEKIQNAFERIRRPMAWLLFPLVLWVHTVVSLDFCTTFVPAWRGAFFPAYFIAGAVFSGLALVNLLLSAEEYRVRLLEKLTLVGSWILNVFWLWNFLLKGDFCVSAFIFAGLLPQLLLVESVRESRLGRNLIYASILLGMLLERVYLVAPAENSLVNNGGFDLVDFGLVSFGCGAFLLLFYEIRNKFSRLIDNDEILVGEVSESEKTLDEKKDATTYYLPLTTPEFHTLRFPLLCGILVSLVYCIWAMESCDCENIPMSIVNVIPVTLPIVAMVAGIMLCAKPLWNACKATQRIMVAVACIVAATLLGAFYSGGSSAVNESLRSEVRAQSALAHDVETDLPDSEKFQTGDGLHHASLLWNSRCSACHGVNGNFNEKFVREFYPVPQILSQRRLDSLGEDSLVHVILKGRGNMNSYSERLSEKDVRSLVRYMRTLAAPDSSSKANSEEIP